LRQKGNTGLWLNEQGDWKELASFVEKPGQCSWYPRAYLIQQEMYPVAVLIYWQIGEKESWCLATNLPDATLTVRYYRRRMWTEEMFGDFKKHGFDLESIMLHHAARLSRLTLAVAFLYESGSGLLPWAPFRRQPDHSRRLAPSRRSQRSPRSQPFSNQSALYRSKTVTLTLNPDATLCPFLKLSGG
jgi:hypothetical protein